MVKHRKIFFSVSGVLFLASVVAFLVWGLNLGIDFTGGSLLEVEYHEARPEIADIERAVNNLDLGGNILLQPADEKGLILRLKDITEDEHRLLLRALGDVEEKRFDSVGPIIGRELKQRAWIAISLTILMIVLFIAWAFRGVSRPIASYKYGLIAIAALIHDITIPVGIFSVLGKFLNIEVGALFVTALLTILGFSVHDTIVVFDRIRENLKKHIGATFEETVEFSLRQVRGRSLKTSVAIVLVLLSLLFFGGETIKYFALALTLGIIFGTYSSLFLASPLVVSWYKWQEKKRK
jgi:preprotein translocase subunit SecF